jgi:prepilin-type N-terminal cleavage/methylation domain-containing protein
MSNRINKKGVSLVEVMISLVILLIVSMGLLQASLLSIDSNVRNELRDEAVRIASESMAEKRSAFDDSNSSSSIERTFRNQKVTFTSDTVSSILDADSKQVTVTVGWDYHGEHFSHSIISIVRRK